MSQREGGSRTVLLGVVTVTTATLSGLALNVAATALTTPGTTLHTLSVVATALLVVLLVMAVLMLRASGWPWGGAAPGGRTPAELSTAAGHAEQWLVALGSDAGGMAASEWFRQEEPALRQLVLKHAADADAVDEVAHICDALDAWYVRERRAADLLDLAGCLAMVAEHAHRRDLTELAAVRAATAHRLAGNLEEANRELGRSAALAPHGRVAAALQARRRVEMALSNLVRADRCEPGSDRDDHLVNARDRLEDAAATLPRADLAADTAIQLNHGVLALYRGNAELASDLLTLVAARAQAAKDVGAHAQAEELLGVAAWMSERPRAAGVRWLEAARLFADIDEREGRARCLQHLGSAALVSTVVARLVVRGAESAQEAALRMLEESAGLRGGTHGHEVLEHYLELAQEGSAPGRADVTDAPAVDAARLIWRRIWRRIRRALTRRWS